MLLINNLCGDYNSETPEGRGANAAANVIKYINEGRKIAEENTKKFLQGNLTPDNVLKNTALETLATAYIPYLEVSEETGEMDIEYGLAFAGVYINSLDKDNDGAISTLEAGPCGRIIDQIDPSGKITKGKFLAWLIFQDCIEVYNGVISPQEAAKAVQWACSDPKFVVEKLKDIYNRLNLKEKENTFKIPEPVSI
ncbi:MAG TPA: hypothetical protein P5556_01135 [Candidatus Gastranaerophilales bacterium]|nr:hypothetical protein [Candidatus Gastranaerophilales bacterium]